MGILQSLDLREHSTRYIMSELTEEEFLEIKEAYELYEKNSENGKVDGLELSKLLRSLGEDPSDAELANMVKDLEIDGQGTFEFPDFLKMMSKRMKDKDSDHELT